jgi:GNAT superfamily N-acetyltransferase
VPNTAELQEIEAFYDTSARASSRLEQIGPLTLFVSKTEIPLFARPTLGTELPITRSDVDEVRSRQRALGVPEAFEWVHEAQPDMAGAVELSGLTVYSLPLMVFRGDATARAVPGVRFRVLTGDDPELPRVQAAIGVGFAATGTEVGAIGEADRDAAEDPAGVTSVRGDIDAGHLVMVGAFADCGPVAGGSMTPQQQTAEISGLSTLPAYRRRGIGSGLTRFLVSEARARGVRMCFLSAGSGAIAKVYLRAGFERVATACIARAAVAV